MHAHTIREVARAAKVSDSTVRNYIEAGAIPAEKVIKLNGGKRRVYMIMPEHFASVVAAVQGYLEVRRGQQAEVGRANIVKAHQANRAKRAQRAAALQDLTSQLERIDQKLSLLVDALMTGGEHGRAE